MKIATPKAKIIFGVDPGSVVTGYGCILSDGKKYRYLDSGTIRLQGKALPPRLGEIFSQLKAIIHSLNPDSFAIEKVFVNKNVQSALTLGHARAAAICAAVENNLDVAEYTPRLVKQSVCGYGNADKVQVQQMVKMLLNIAGKISSDEADGLAVAITHASHMNVPYQQQDNIFPRLK